MGQIHGRVCLLQSPSAFQEITFKLVGLLHQGAQGIRPVSRTGEVAALKGESGHDNQQ